MTLRPAIFAFFALLCLALSARADAPPEPNTARVYVGRGQIFIVSVPRQLTLNAHVSQVLVQPGSLEAAYVGATLDGDALMTFVRLAGLRHGETQTLLSETEGITAPGLFNQYELAGWSGDGRYLIVSHDGPVEAVDAAPGLTETVYDSVDVGVIPPKVHRVLLPADTSNGGSFIGGMLASPSGKLFAVQYRDAVQPGKMTDAPAPRPFVRPAQYAFFYDPAKDSVRRLILPAGSRVRGWTDDAHLLLLTHPNTTRHSVAFDIHTGTETSTTNTSAKPSFVSRRFPEVTLSLTEMPAVLPAPDEKTHADVRAVWLAVKGAKPQPIPVCLGVTLGRNTLNAELVPDHSAALWLQNGDLYVSTFTEEAATVREKYDAGDVLTCDEERQVAGDNAKQLGLGLIQYTQDWDEQFPPAANFHDGLYPYIKNEGVFHEGTHPFQYAAPADLHLSAMEDPAHTVLGMIALPCAVVTLYADGHVTSEPLSPAVP